MTSTILPILGQGSQPTEVDGAELDYLPMPEEIFTYRMPQVSSDLRSEKLAPARQILSRLQQNLLDYPTPAEKIDLLSLNDDNCRFIDELLGEGEVSIILNGTHHLRIQEAVLAGVWRTQQWEGQNQIADMLEVDIVPQSLRQFAFVDAAEHINTDMSQLPDGVMNSPPLLAELNSAIARYQPGAEAHIINLSLLPQTDQDLAFLDQRLGKGKLAVLSRGYGNCRITATASRYVWWVQYFNSQDTLILNTLEVSDVPNVVCAAAEDIADSCQRLQEILQVYL